MEEEARQEKNSRFSGKWMKTLRQSAGMLVFEPILFRFAAQTAETLGVSVGNAETLYALGRVHAVRFGRAAICDENRFLLWDVYTAEPSLDLAAVCGAICAHSARPEARAIAEAARMSGVSRLAVSRFSELKKGRQFAAAGIVNGKRYLIGELSALEKADVQIPPAARFADGEEQRILYVAEEGIFAGFFLLYPALLPGIRGAAEALGKIGVRALAEPDACGIAARAGLEKNPCGAREKGLREKRKNDTITFDGGTLRFPFGETLSLPSGRSLCGVLLLGRVVRQIRFQNVLLIPVLFCTFLSLVPVSPLLAVLVTFLIRFSKTAADLHALSHFSPQMPAAEEEKPMFGKVSYTLVIEGMSCAHCSARVKAALETLRGVCAEISLEEKTARVRCPSSLDPEKLTAAVTDAGYTVVSNTRV